MPRLATCACVTGAFATRTRAHCLPARHVLVVRRERFETRLAVYRTARLLHRRDRRLSVIEGHEVVAIRAGQRGVPSLDGRCTKRLSRAATIWLWVGLADIPPWPPL